MNDCIIPKWFLEYWSSFSCYIIELINSFVSLKDNFHSSSCSLSFSQLVGDLFKLFKLCVVFGGIVCSNHFHYASWALVHWVYWFYWWLGQFIWSACSVEKVEVGSGLWRTLFNHLGGGPFSMHSIYNMREPHEISHLIWSPTYWQYPEICLVYNSQAIGRWNLILCSRK